MYLHFENTNIRTELMIETKIPWVQNPAKTNIHTNVRGVQIKPGESERWIDTHHIGLP